LAISAVTALAWGVGTFGVVFGDTAKNDPRGLFSTSTTLRFEAYIGVIMLAVEVAGRTRLRPIPTTPVGKI